MKRTFRRLIILNWVTVVVAVIVSLATRKYLPAELTQYQESRRQIGVTHFDWVVFCIEVVLLILTAINSIGLFLFRRWAKRLLVPLYVIATLFYPANPVYIQTGWTRMVFSIGSVIGGMTIALVFFSPIAEVFDRAPDAEHVVGPERGSRVSQLD